MTIGSGFIVVCRLHDLKRGDTTGECLVIWSIIRLNSSSDIHYYKHGDYEFCVAADKTFGPAGHLLNTMQRGNLSVIESE